MISADQDKVVLKMLKGERVVLLELNSEQVQIDKVDAYQIDNQELTYFLDNNKHGNE